MIITASHLATAVIKKIKYNNSSITPSHCSHLTNGLASEQHQEKCHSCNLSTVTMQSQHRSDICKMCKCVFSVFILFAMVAGYSENGHNCSNTPGAMSGWSSEYLTHCHTVTRKSSGMRPIFPRIKLKVRWVCWAVQTTDLPLQTKVICHTTFLFLTVKCAQV